MMSPKMSDEPGSILNSKKEDKIVVKGLTSINPMPQEVGKRRNWLSEMLGGVSTALFLNLQRTFCSLTRKKKNHQGNFPG